MVGDNSTTIENKYDNYNDLLNEIKQFVSCPKLIEPLIDNGDSFCELEDNELAKKLDSQLLNVLVSSSSLCDTESLISEFSLSDDDDDLDRIVEQLQTATTTTNDEQTVSMPTLQSLFTAKDTSLPSTNEQNKINKLNNDEINKLNRRKIKFMQHQTKVNYSFSNELSVRLFDKLITFKNKFNNNAENMIENQNTDEKSEKNESKKRRKKQLNQTVDIQLIEQEQIRLKNQQQQQNKSRNLIDPIIIENNVLNCISSKNKNTHKLNNLDNQQNKLSLSKDLDREVKRKIENNRTMNKKPKSEIFTLKSNKNKSSLDNLLASIRSK